MLHNTLDGNHCVCQLEIHKVVFMRYIVRLPQIQCKYEIFYFI